MLIQKNEFFLFPLAEHQKIRYNRNMSITFRNTIRLEEYAGMGLMPEKPCGTGFHGGGANSKGSAKLFHADDKKYTS